MSTPATLPLSDIVDVIVLVSPQAPAQPTFNQGLIVGSSTVIPASERVRKYTSTDAMLSDGFSLSSPEYIAAQIYFGQEVPPQVLWVGRQDLTSINTWALNSGATGTGYSVNDVLTVAQGGGASGATLLVTAVNGSGAVTAATLLTPGTGYTVAAGIATTGGHGSNAEVNINSIGDTPLYAVEQCRIASPAWWGVMVTTAATQDHEDIAAYAQSAVPPMMYFYATSDATAASGATGNIFSTLKSLSYNRACGIYTTTQGGQFPNNIYAGAAIMGMAMGLNTGLANSYFTFKFKTLVGIAVEPLSETTVGIITNNNGNLYLNFGNSYNIFQQGVVANGQFADEILNLDMLSSGIQFAVMNVLVETPAVPLTDPGVTQLMHAVNTACQAALVRGFIAPGTWEGVQIINLKPGDPINQGYLTQAYPVATLTTAQRNARQAPPIYTAIIEAGAAHFLTVGVYVQR